MARYLGTRKGACRSTTFACTELHFIALRTPPPKHPTPLRLPRPLRFADGTSRC